MPKKPTIPQSHAFKYFEVLLGMFIAVLIVSNVVSTKLITVGPLTFIGGAVLFPFAYIFGDIFTEVYGYAKARRVIWTGFAALLVLTISLLVVQYLPPAPFWPNQTSYEVILGFVPRIVLASICGYIVGEFVNSYVMARMKIYTKGKHLWSRTVGSTVAGEGADTIVFNAVAFLGVLSLHNIATIAMTAYFIKVALEILMTPVTYAVVGFLKRQEGVDPLDVATNFSPFTLEEQSI